MKRKRKSNTQKRRDDPRSKLWLAKADALWSELIRRKGECEKCHARNVTLNAHHLITKSKKNTRHLLQNGICLCYHDHRVGQESAHDDPAVFHQWLRETYPERDAWVSDHKWDSGRPDYRAAYERLEGIRRELACAPAMRVDVVMESA